MVLLIIRVKAPHPSISQRSTDTRASSRSSWRMARILTVRTSMVSHQRCLLVRTAGSIVRTYYDAGLVNERVTCLPLHPRPTLLSITNSTNTRSTRPLWRRVFYLQARILADYTRNDPWTRSIYPDTLTRRSDSGASLQPRLIIYQIMKPQTLCRT